MSGLPENRKDSSFRVEKVIRRCFSSPRGRKLESPLRLKREIEKLKEEAIRDSLTGIYNRKGLEELFEKYIGIWKRNNELPLFLFVVDLDYFKDVNDTLGHEVGDSLLREIASAWKESLRKADVVSVVNKGLTERENISDLEFSIGRTGGDEFVILAFTKDPEVIESRLRDVFSSVLTSFEVSDDLKSKLGFSLGHAKIGEGFETSVDISRLSNEELFLKAIKIADMRMYEDKKGKKNGSR